MSKLVRMACGYFLLISAVLIECNCGSPHNGIGNAKPQPTDAAPTEPPPEKPVQNLDKLTDSSGSDAKKSSVPEHPLSWPDRVAATQWHWKEELSEIDGCMDFYNDMHTTYQFRIATVTDAPGPSFRVKRDDNVIFSLNGIPATFALKENTLYYGGVLRTGGYAIIAYDLEAKKELWRSKLPGVDITEQRDDNRSAYFEVEKDALRMNCQEKTTNVVEFFHLDTGASLGRKLFHK